MESRSFARLRYVNISGHYLANLNPSLYNKLEQMKQVPVLNHL